MKKISYVVLSIVIGCTLLFFVMQQIGWRAIIATLRTFSIQKCLFISCTFFAQFLFIVLSLRNILSSFNCVVPFRRLYVYQCIKYTIGYITPFMNVGGEPAQVYLLNKHDGVSLPTASTAIFLERMLRLTIAIIIFAIGIIVAFSRLILSNETKVVLAIVGVSFLVFLVVFYRVTLAKKGFFERLLRMLGLGRALDRHVRFGKAVKHIDTMNIDFFNKHPRHFLISFMWALCSLITLFIQSYFLLRFLSYTPRMTDLLLIFTLQNLLMLVPIPASLGTYETGNAILFALQEIGSGTGVAYTLALRIANLVVLIPGILGASYYGIRVKNFVEKPRIV